MSTISEKLTQLNTIKGDIKTAINNKGGEVGNDFSTYATAINNLNTGSGEIYENPEFYEARTNNSTNFDHLFRDYNGPDIDVSQWDTSKVTSAKYCFSNCTKSIDINNWNLSNLIYAQYMFEKFTNGNKYIDLSALDFSNVTNANYMFSYSNTDYLDIRNINLTGTTSYNYLFSGCHGAELDLSIWDISNVTDLSGMASNAYFKKINLTGWKTTNVKNFGYMFNGYSSPLEILMIPDWDMTNATSTKNFILTSASKLKYVDLSRSNDLTIKKIASFLPTKTATAYGEILVPANTSQDAIDTLTAKYWKPIGPKFDLNSTEVALELDEIKPYKTTKVYTGNSDPWYGDDSLEAIEFISSDESIATVNGREITGVAEGTVTVECRRREDNLLLGSATLTVSETDSKPNLIKFRTIGSESSSTTLATINGVSLTPSKITKNVAGVYSYDPGEQITSLNFGVYVNEIVKFNFNAANFTTIKGIFSSYVHIENLDLTGWNVSNITDMSSAFSMMEYTVYINITGWDTSNVTNMESMFSYSHKLVDIIGALDLSNLSNGFDGANRGDSIVNECNNLETLYLKNIYKNCTMDNDNDWSIGLGHTKVKDECLLYIINELPDLYAKGLTNTDQITFTLPPTNALTAEQVQPAIDKGWTFINVNY